MSSCRGILIAGVTNQARTQMAEGFLRSFMNNAVFISSGGWRHGGCVHPFAVKAMADVGIRIDRQSSTSLEGARRQRSTYDVYVSIDDPYPDRGSDRYHQQQRQQPWGEREEEQDAERGNSGEGALSAAASSSRELFSDPLLASATPKHWTVAQDSTDGRQAWTLWSPRDPRIFHATSTRKLQDHLYEGEPLFARVRPTELRRGCRVQRRWQVPSVTERYAVETAEEQLARVVDARTQLAPLCMELIRGLEEDYGETLLDAAAVAAYTAAVAAKAAETKEGHRSITGEKKLA
ncbi:putative mitochondrial low molecular weight protein tyrosine phosphatase [Leptomonas pyrrhocoris]|uniref:Putative mitochondrial low molecular weight protein tyrosine phosphatase n=1 Tax=Leptomonas pyrrhocoris TaxID=157538 RepID=A0A0N0DQT8_LEPPY|nr:putative mitochondrial low molecular weight protein tyrosine phosphatase [Leptomonas pyrrhocoris]KPA73662.1 putative mitochondrial low molecular weight protein tyrosine phosphatase [Leptomonas pyrrhocoris]|eukprot:XP_015652101.1 putative mitochondrial low molecular weight protein tyrosine phosphatase [Leptomonas pyrrhocoris]